MKLLKCYFGLVSAFLFLVGCQGYKYNPDNLLEEVVEEAIEAKTGVELDLSQENPEKGFRPTSIKFASKEEVKIAI